MALEVELKAHQEQVQLLLRKMSLLEADLLDFHALRHSESSLRQQLSDVQKKYVLHPLYYYCISVPK